MLTSRDRPHRHPRGEPAALPTAWSWCLEVGRHAWRTRKRSESRLEPPCSPAAGRGGARPPARLPGAERECARRFRVSAGTGLRHSSTSSSSGSARRGTMRVNFRRRGMRPRADRGRLDRVPADYFSEGGCSDGPISRPAGGPVRGKGRALQGPGPHPVRARVLELLAAVEGTVPSRTSLPARGWKRPTCPTCPSTTQCCAAIIW